MGSRLIKYAFRTQNDENLDTIIKVPKDPRGIIHGVVKDYNGDIAENAVVQLYEVLNEPNELKSLTHTFTDESGHFLFGPLLPDKQYAIKIWVNNVKIKQVVVDPKHTETFEALESEDIQNFEDEEY